ncbi:hypothetical protein [Streptomyces sp. NPDC021356]|uniref:hypothetical protein n=1 Tax=Streptomyces sp. NPDC021356 TaxID=3154900 RepID=UPI0033CE7017
MSTAPLAADAADPALYREDRVAALPDDQLLADRDRVLPAELTAGRDLGAAGTAESHGHAGVRSVPVSDAPDAPVHLARPARPTHPRTEDFLAAVRDVVSDSGGGGPLRGEVRPSGGR